MVISQIIPMPAKSVVKKMAIIADRIIHTKKDNITDLLVNNLFHIKEKIVPDHIISIESTNSIMKVKLIVILYLINP